MTREIASSTQGDAAPAAARPARRRWRPTIAVALIFGFGLIVLVAVSSVMWVALGTAQKNTVTLLRTTADVAVARLIDQITIHLRAARSPSEFLAEMIGSGEIGATRSEDRRVGHACVSTCCSRWPPYHYTQQKT